MDRIFSVVLISEIILGPYIFSSWTVYFPLISRWSMTHIWFLGTVYFMQKDRIFSARWPYSFNNYKNRAASRILKIRIFMKDCVMFYFERLQNLSMESINVLSIKDCKIFIFKRFRNLLIKERLVLWIWKIWQSFVVKEWLLTEFGWFVYCLPL